MENELSAFLKDNNVPNPDLVAMECVNAMMPVAAHIYEVNNPGQRHPLIQEQKDVSGITQTQSQSQSR